MSEEDIFLLINKHLTGEINHQEQLALDEWLDQSEQNQQVFSRLVQIWEASGNLSLNLDLDTEKAWRQIEQGTQPEAKRWIHFQPSVLMKVAASLVLLVALGVLFFLLTPENQIIHQTAADERLQIRLPDSSTVWLNQHSQLTYNASFNTNRTVNLSGEAYFEVTHQQGSPFTVETGSISTVVLGTAFMVKDYLDSDRSEVAVSTGKVRVNSLSNPTGEVFLEANTQVSFDKISGELAKSVHRNRNFLAWKDRVLHFENTPLDEIELVLENYFTIEVTLTNQRLATCQFTGTFNDPTLDEILEVLDVALDMKHVVKEGVYEFNGDGCEVIDN